MSDSPPRSLWHFVPNTRREVVMAVVCLLVGAVGVTRVPWLTVERAEVTEMRTDLALCRQEVAACVAWRDSVREKLAACRKGAP